MICKFIDKSRHPPGVCYRTKVALVRFLTNVFGVSCGNLLKSVFFTPKGICPLRTPEVWWHFPLLTFSL